MSMGDGRSQNPQLLRLLTKHVLEIMTPNEITRPTIACIASPIGAVGVVQAATSFSSVSIERSLLTPHNMAVFFAALYGSE